MELIFEAKTYPDDSQIEDNAIENYTQGILSIYNSMKDNLDLSLFKTILVPEDYKTGLFEFQCNNGHAEFVTENEYGQGVAQVVTSASDSGETVYNIVIDKNMIFMLILDDLLEPLKNNLGEEQFKILL